jgi:hypothetical protein
MTMTTGLENAARALCQAVARRPLSAKGNWQTHEYRRENSQAFSASAATKL